MTIEEPERYGSAVIKKRFRLDVNDRPEYFITNIIDYIKKILPSGKVIFDEENNKLTFNYHGRPYCIEFSSVSRIVDTKGFPQKAVIGSIDMLVKFPISFDGYAHKNKSNMRLARRLDREVNLPCLFIDEDGLGSLF